ncbi:hypothetical protein AYL99_09003 [Fonsecaea erecta]|uniref:Kinesin light chain n=1 Tax=Fonsecaea erecta TaxID=1367422 RepID=A0A178ZBN6_9EURO|nr:hypothetical protein AYL99_09003 [Fonsecaea erecta]OAP56891.1 hypothetical protein AYL99_09003 [Fonsecaea erecta]
MNNLAAVLSDQGKYEAAEQMHREVVEVRERVLGKEHLSTLTSMNNVAGVLCGDVYNNLALVLSDQGKYEAAEQMHREVVEVIERALGKEHPSTLTSINNLALVLSHQGKYEAAEQMHREVVEVRERVLGKEHPETLTSINNLAAVLSDQGKYEAAEQMYREVVEVTERVLGKEHPSTLTSINNLAAVLSDQGKYEAAEQMYREVVEVTERVLRKEHPSTLTSINNLAAVLRHQGKYEAAEQIYREVVEVTETVLGKEHLSTLTSMNNFAAVLSDQGKYEEAEQIQAVVVVGMLRVFGFDHPNSKIAINIMLAIWKYQDMDERTMENALLALLHEAKLDWKNHQILCPSFQEPSPPVTEPNGRIDGIIEDSSPEAFRRALFFPGGVQQPKFVWIKTWILTDFENFDKVEIFGHDRIERYFIIHNSIQARGEGPYAKELIAYYCKARAFDEPPNLAAQFCSYGIFTTEMPKSSSETSTCVTHELPPTSSRRHFVVGVVTAFLRKSTFWRQCFLVPGTVLVGYRDGDDPIFQAEGSGIANLLGIPILARAQCPLGQVERDGDPEVVLDGRCNPAAEVLLRDITSRTTGVQETPTIPIFPLDDCQYMGENGFGSSPMYWKVCGSAFLVRADGVPLLSQHVEALLSYIREEVEPRLAKALVGVAPGDVVAGRENVLNSITPADFSRYFDAFKVSQSAHDSDWEDLESPYAMTKETIARLKIAIEERWEIQNSIHDRLTST